MILKTQKKTAGRILKCSPSRITFDPERLEEIKEAITKFDLRRLIKDKAIAKEQEKSVSRSRARKIAQQKAKGRQKGLGSRKGKEGARTPAKKTWIASIRLQRSFLAKIKEKELIDKKTYRSLYQKAKGGFFRNKRHIKLYLEENNLIKK